MAYPVYKLLENSAQQFASHTAICDEYGSLSFSDLFSQSALLKTKLQELGVYPGSGLGLMAKNSREFIIGLFAGLGCGATVMPVSHHLKTEELNSLLTDAPLNFMIDDGSGTAPLGIEHSSVRFVNKTINFTKFKDSTEPLVPHVPNAACVRFTSGTTGKSKGVVLSHNSILERTEAAQRSLNLNQNDTVIWTLPMAYHFVVSIIMYIRYGATISICRNDLAQTIIRAGQEHGGTLLYASPSHYRTLVEDSSGESIPTLTRAISTSAGISPHTEQNFRRQFGMPITQIYGIIEVGLPAGNLDDPEKFTTSIGKALPGYSLAILDDNLDEVPAGTIGQLAIKGPGMFDAYLTPPRVRSEVLHDGWFLTGDLAFRNTEGYVTVAGRRKSLINVSGHKVFPEEVEAVINAHDSIAVSRVYRKEHPEMGDIVAAELVLRNGNPPSKEELYNFFQEKLSSHKIPRQIEFVSKISMTGTGKILR